MRNILVPAGLLVGLTLLVTFVVAGAPKPDTRTASQEGRPANPCAVQKQKSPANPCAPENPCAVPRASN